MHQNNTNFEKLIAIINHNISMFYLLIHDLNFLVNFID